LKKISCIVGTLAVSAVCANVFGPGVAAADDYAGKKYSDVTAALADANMTPVIATRTGDTLNDDDCIVTHSAKAPWIKGDDFAPVTDTMLLYLNCYSGVASGKTSGNSKASVEGKAAIEAANQEEQQQQQAVADQGKAKH
jgi:hypothetical protein